MSRSVSIDEMAAAINEGLEEYADLSAQGVKSAVRKSAKAVKEQINSSAPVRTGRYAKSWAVKITAESSQSLEQTVYSPSRYMLSHLLEEAAARAYDELARVYHGNYARLNFPLPGEQGCRAIA